MTIEMAAKAFNTDSWKNVNDPDAGDRGAQFTCSNVHATISIQKSF
jgi:hypothetical protein